MCLELPPSWPALMALFRARVSVTGRAASCVLSSRRTAVRSACWVERIGPGTGGRDLAVGICRVQPAGTDVPGRDLDARGSLLLADGHREGAARVEAAAGGRGHQAGRR